VARYTEHESDTIFEVVERWRDRCLLDDGSLLGEGRVWTRQALERLHEQFNGNPIVDGRLFEEKLKEQTAGDPSSIRLIAEVLIVHFLFAVGAVNGPRKREVVNEVLSWVGETLEPRSLVDRALGQGIGNPGQGFNARRDLQVGFVIDFAKRFKALDAVAQRDTLLAADRLSEFMDASDEPKREMRHILLHLLLPDDFERIASGSHKASIAKAFAGLLDASSEDADVDERLRRIRERLHGLMPEGNTGKAGSIDFYHPPLNGVWDPRAAEEGVGELEALEYKRQIVFYGPPGTGKTHEAKILAERLIRRHALRALGFERFLTEADRVDQLVAAHVRRLQLHPAYSYEDFIGGIHLEGGETVYRPGYLVRLVREIDREAAQAEPAIPWVLILDEINRADLSRLLGEAFSLLEDRGSTVDLIGAEYAEADGKLHLPAELFLVGTMNLIDQSVEQLDFALRRRFLWVKSGYDPDALVRVLEQRWSDQPMSRLRTWDVLESDVQHLAEQASALNEAIATSPLLGEQYEIGHTYFFDVTAFLNSWLESRKTRPSSNLLWDKNSKARPPIVDIWARSLEPLLHEYLAGVDAAARSNELGRLRRTFVGS